MKTKICLICTVISAIWLSLSAGIAWGFLSSAYLTAVALLMGGTVVGIAYQADRKFKLFIILLGMPLAYLFVANLNRLIVVIEFVIIILIAYLLFVKSFGTEDNTSLSKRIEEKLKHCC